jgi:hypothetical protein
VRLLNGPLGKQGRERDRSGKIAMPILCLLLLEIDRRMNVLPVFVGSTTRDSFVKGWRVGWKIASLPTGSLGNGLSSRPKYL